MLDLNHIVSICVKQGAIFNGRSNVKYYKKMILTYG